MGASVPSDTMLARDPFTIRMVPTGIPRGHHCGRQDIAPTGGRPMSVE